MSCVFKRTIQCHIYSLLLMFTKSLLTSLCVRVLGLLDVISFPWIRSGQPLEYFCLQFKSF